MSGGMESYMRAWKLSANLEFNIIQTQTHFNVKAMFQSESFRKVGTLLDYDGLDPIKDNHVEL